MFVRLAGWMAPLERSWRRRMPSCWSCAREVGVLRAAPQAQAGLGRPGGARRPDPAAPQACADGRLVTPDTLLHWAPKGHPERGGLHVRPGCHRSWRRLQVEALDDAHAGRFQVIVVWTLDRINRDGRRRSAPADPPVQALRLHPGLGQEILAERGPGGPGCPGRVRRLDGPAGIPAPLRADQGTAGQAPRTRQTGWSAAPRRRQEATKTQRLRRILGEWTTPHRPPGQGSVAPLLDPLADRHAWAHMLGGGALPDPIQQ